ncbi:histidine kinase N-terminal 7TM domain-containing protein [Cupriavidus necator]|uniref:histidine kinase N-terminal 7TM domain-containing protein n=1 Tax=Cupriavidus necator TaxID=106590 RepID=UPI0027881258|nr:histidine kinase N-terminal 7TM domain-containing protein [Cupriavidus necator]MDQ0139900.1 diguanylate cyclase (GGDEF)-like protein [Cupriavidus necator]
MPSYSLVLLLTVAVVACIGMAIATWPRRDDPTVQAFLVLAAGAATWSGGRLLEISSTDLAGRILWAKIQYLGIVAVPIGWLVAMVHLSRPRYVVPWSRLWLPVLAAVVTVVMVFTNERHGLVWPRITLMPHGVSPGAVFHHGIGYAVVAAWSYLLLAVSLYFLVTAEVPNGALSHRGRAILAAGLALPLVANVAYLNRWTGPLGGDLTPATFSLMAALVWFCGLRTHLDDIGHYARLRVFDALSEGCVIVDRHGTIVELNPAAAQLWPALRRGDPLPAGWDTALRPRGASAAAPFVPPGAPFELTGERIARLDGRQMGSLLFLRDISRFQSREMALSAQLGQTEEQLWQVQADLDIDALTGIRNRRYFQRESIAAVTRACEHGQPLGLLILDVDQFKQYNDLHGHMAGDDCLRQIASALSSVLHGEQFCARLGGEEFAAVLPGATRDETREVGRRMVAVVRDLGIAHHGTPVQPVVTISVGAVWAVPEAPRLEPLLHRADSAMYRAKRAGRNRFMLDGDA